MFSTAGEIDELAVWNSNATRVMVMVGAFGTKRLEYFLQKRRLPEITTILATASVTRSFQKRNQSESVTI